MHDIFPRGSRRRAYSLMELMVAVAVFAVGASIAYPLLVSDMNLYVRNFSLNKSNNSLRHSLQMLKKDVDMAVEAPLLMGYRVSGATGVLKPLPTANSAQAIMMWVNLGPAYDMQPAGGVVDTTGDIALTRHVYSKADPTPSAPIPQPGDRLLIESPDPSSAGMPDSVTMDGVTITKPGRAITFAPVVGNTPGSPSIDASDNATANFTVRISQTNPLPAGILGAQTVYLLREVAYVAYNVTDAGGNVVERQLLYYPTTANMAKATVLIRDLDPNTQEIDTNVSPAATAQPFNYYAAGGRGVLSPLSVNLPIRALDYSHAIGDRNLAAGTADQSSTEFNLFLRSNPQLGIKVNLD